jgi:hypothetical protein
MTKRHGHGLWRRSSPASHCAPGRRAPGCHAPSTADLHLQPPQSSIGGRPFLVKPRDPLCRIRTRPGASSGAATAPIQASVVALARARAPCCPGEGVAPTALCPDGRWRVRRGPDGPMLDCHVVASASCCPSARWLVRSPASAPWTSSSPSGGPSLCPGYTSLVVPMRFSIRVDAAPTSTSNHASLTPSVVVIREEEEWL